MEAAVRQRDLQCHLYQRPDTRAELIVLIMADNAPAAVVTNYSGDTVVTNYSGDFAVRVDTLASLLHGT